MRIKVVSIPVEGPITVEEIDNSSLEDFRRMIGGGWLEALTLEEPDGVMWLDEEGKLKALKLNKRATTISKTHSFDGKMIFDWIVGDVIITGPGDSSGNTMTAPEFYLEIATTGE